MARPQVPDGRGGLQICKVAANMMNKPTCTADKRQSFRFGTKAHIPILYRNARRDIAFGGICDLGKEPSAFIRYLNCTKEQQLDNWFEVSVNCIVDADTTQ